MCGVSKVLGWVAASCLLLSLVACGSNDSDRQVQSVPVAEAGSNQSVWQGATVRLDGSASQSSDGSPLFYSWQFESCPKNSCPMLEDRNSARPSFFAYLAGTYLLRLEVTDGNYVSASDTVSVFAEEVVQSDPDLLRQQWNFGTTGFSIGRQGMFVVDLDKDGVPEILASGTAFWQVIKAVDGRYEQVWQSENHPYPGIVAFALVDSDDDGTEEIYVGLGDGTIRIYGANLEETAMIATGEPFDAMAVADLDADGAWEIVTASHYGIFVYSADSGELKWKRTAGGGRTLRVGDVDADPALEIVTSAYAGPGFIIDGISGEVEWENADGFGALIELADLDGDGVMEIIGAAPWYKITIFSADQKGTAWEIPTSMDVSAMLLVDVDGDGGLELIYGDGQREGIHCVDTKTRTERWSIDNPESGVAGLAFGDFDADGRGELLWGSIGSSSGSNLFVADPLAGEIEWQNIQLGGPLSAMDVGDVDDDGHDEIVMVTRDSAGGYAEGIIHIFDARTHALKWRSKLGTPDFMGARSVRIGDVDNDGRTEFVVATGYHYRGLLQIYDGATRTLKRQSAGYEGNYFATIEIGDVDGDGRTEIVAGQGMAHSGAEGIFLISFDGATLAEKWRSANMGGNSSAEIYDLALADADGDGRTEIVASLLDSRIIVYDGVTHELQWLAEHPAYAVAVWDTDGDGTPEILVGRDDGDIDVFDGSTFMRESTSFGFSKQPIEALQINDLDGDGIAEWLVASFGHLTIQSGDTRALKWSSKNLSENLGLQNQVHIRDTDGDGHKEIFLGANISVYEFELGASSGK